jgi:nucleoside-diphosphate-sugar epimerase
MAVMVVGGAGYIGSVTVRALLRAGRTVVVYDDLSTGFRAAVPAGVAFEQGSTHDAARVERLVADYGVDVAIHFAAKKAAGDSMFQPGHYFEENVAGTNTLLDAVRRAGVNKVVFSSSAAVYGNVTTLPIGEDTPKRPENPYGESKLMVEQMLRWYDTCHSLRSVSLRYFNAAGAADDGEVGEDFAQSTNLVPVLMKAVLGKRPPLEIFGTDYPTRDGSAVRDYIHVEDLATGHVKAVEYLERGGATTAINLGTSRGSSVWEIIRAAEAVIGGPVPYVESPRRAGDAVELYADISRARELLGWEPVRGIAEIMDSEWKWRQRRPGGFLGALN